MPRMDRHERLWRVFDFRGPRMRRFLSLLRVTATTRVLDVGGRAAFWPPGVARVTLGIHWLPRSWRVPVGRRCSVNRTLNADYARAIRLLTKREMRALFPDCAIHTERWCGLPKSYIAVRQHRP